MQRHGLLASHALYTSTAYAEVTLCLLSPLMTVQIHDQGLVNTDERFIYVPFHGMNLARATPFMLVLSSTRVRVMPVQLVRRSFAQ